MLVKVVTKKFRVHCAVLNARTRQVWFAHVHRVTAVMARGKRPVPFRTRKLSLSAPMVLPWRRGGRVGHRRTTIPHRGASIRAGAPVGISSDALRHEATTVLRRRQAGTMLTVETPRKQHLGTPGCRALLAAARGRRLGRRLRHVTEPAPECCPSRSQGTTRRIPGKATRAAIRATAAGSAMASVVTDW